MGLAVLIHLALLGVLVALPGWMLYRLWLQRLGLSWRVSVGLMFAVLSVLLSDLAALFDYSLSLALGICCVVILAIAIGWVIAGRKEKDASTRGRNWANILSQLFIFGFYLTPAFVLYVPFDTDAQGFGYLALMVREGGTLYSLAPWQPEVHYLYSPIAPVWWAFLSDLLNLPMHQVMLPFTHIVAGFIALLGIDLGKALMPGKERMGWLFPLMIVLGFSLMLRVLDSAYTSVVGLFFVTLFLTLAFSVVREGNIWRDLMGSIVLAAAALSSPDAIVSFLIGYLPFYATFWLSRSQHRRRSVWARLFLLMPGIGILLTLPWLATTIPLFMNAQISAPIGTMILPPNLQHWPKLTLYHGCLVPLLALIGAVIAIRRRWLTDVLAITWLVFLIDFSLTGVIAAVGRRIGINVLRFIYPMAMGWHGPILPYAYLAAQAVDYLLDLRPMRWPRRLSIALPAMGLSGLVLAVVFQRPLLDVSCPFLHVYGSFSSRADLAAMTYLRENTPKNSLVLNYPLGFEGHWVPVIAERQSTAFREQPFFANAESAYARRQALEPTYFDLSQPGASELLRNYSVSYIIIPQNINRPEVFGDMNQLIRWRGPDNKWRALAWSPDEIDWLELVFDQDSAQIYRVIPPDM